MHQIRHARPVIMNLSSAGQGDERHVWRTKKIPIRILIGIEFFYWLPSTDLNRGPIG